MPPAVAARDWNPLPSLQQLLFQSSHPESTFKHPTLSPLPPSTISPEVQALHAGITQRMNRPTHRKETLIPPRCHSPIREALERDSGIKIQKGDYLIQRPRTFVLQLLRSIVDPMHALIYVGNDQVVGVEGDIGEVIVVSKLQPIVCGNLGLVPGCRFSREDVVKRALESVGPFKYNPFTMNCQHFVHWCQTNEYYSFQTSEMVPKWLTELPTKVLPQEVKLNNVMMMANEDLIVSSSSFVSHDGWNDFSDLMCIHS